MTKPILDPACGGRMFWFDKQNPLAVFVDNRELATEKLSNGQTFEVQPDIMADFTALPFEDEAFWHVVFDPPHLTHNAGESSWLVKKYGKLPKDWASYIKAGFDECWRVLKPNGTLVFKWNEDKIRVSEIIRAIGREPLYGHRSGRASKSHWMVFMKTEEEP